MSCLWKPRLQGTGGIVSVVDGGIHVRITKQFIYSLLPHVRFSFLSSSRRMSESNTLLDAIVNLSLKQGKYPDGGKIVRTEALHKKGDRFDPKNHRPIAMASPLSFS